MEQAGKGADSDALVFVYGSLKRGMANHRELKGARWIGGATLRGLELYDLGPFPMAITSADDSSVLQGELYAVDGALLEQLDRFEGAPRLYQRELHRLSSGEAVWVYVGRARQVRHVQQLSSGCWQGPASSFRREGSPPASVQPQPWAKPAATPPAKPDVT